MTDYIVPGAQADEYVIPGQERPVGVAEDMARALPGAVGGIATGVPGLPVNLLNLSMSGIQKITQGLNKLTGLPAPAPAPQVYMGSSQYFRDLARRNLPEAITDPLLYEPKTIPGKITQAAAEFAGGGALGGPAMAARMAGVGVVTEGAGQAADRFSPTLGTATRILLGLAGGHVSMAPMNAVKNAARELHIATDGLTPDQIRRAVDMELRAITMGTPLVGGEALGPAGARVQRLSSDVMASGNAPQLEAARLARQGQVEGAVTGPGGILETISPHRDPAIPAGARTAATQPLYQAADLETIPQNSIAPIYGQAVDVADRTALPGVRSYRDELAQKTGGVADVRVGPYATQYQGWRDRLNLNPAVNPRAVDARTRGEINDLNSQLATTLETQSPGFRAAQDRYREMSPPVTAAETRQAMAEQFDNALNSGGKGAPIQPAAGARFAQTVRGRGTAESSIRRAEFDRQVRQALEARGLRGAELDRAVADMNARMDVLALQDQIPGMGSPTAPRGQRDARMSENRLASLLKSANPMQGSLLRTVPAWLNGTTLRATNRALDRILANPNSTDEILGLLARYGRNGPNPAVPYGGLLGLIEAQQAQ